MCHEIIRSTSSCRFSINSFSLFIRHNIFSPVWLRLYLWFTQLTIVLISIRLSHLLLWREIIILLSLDIMRAKSKLLVCVLACEDVLRIIRHRCLLRSCVDTGKFVDWVDHLGWAWDFVLVKHVQLIWWLDFHVYFASFK